MRTNEEILNDIVSSKDFSVLSSNKEGFLNECKRHLKPHNSQIADYVVDIDDGWNVRVVIFYGNGETWCIRFFTIGGEWTASIDVNEATEEQIEQFIGTKTKA